MPSSARPNAAERRQRHAVALVVSMARAETRVQATLSAQPQTHRSIGAKVQLPSDAHVDTDGYAVADQSSHAASSSECALA